MPLPPVEVRLAIAKHKFEGLFSQLCKVMVLQNESVFELIR